MRWKVDRPGVISGYSTPTVYEPASGAKQVIIPESFQLSAYSVADGSRVWWVRGLPCEMKSVASYDREYLYINGWGFPQNQPGQQVATVPFEDGLKRYDRDGDGFVGRTEISGTDPMDKMLAPSYGFDAFDLDRDGRLDAKEWDVFRRMMASENGLLAIKLGGRGDMTDDGRAVALPAARAAGAVDAALPGHALHGERQRHPDVVRSRHGQRAEAGPAEGRHRQVLRVAGRRRRQGVPRQPGRHGVGRVRGGELGDPRASTRSDDEVFATPAIADGRIYIRTKSMLYAFGK